MPACGSNCQIIRQSIGNFPPPLPLVRQTHKTCSNGNCSVSVSDYEHNFCYKCAPFGSAEYNYHHSRCITSRIVNN